MAKKKRSLLLRVFTGLFLLLLVGGGAATYFGYRMIYTSNVSTGDKRSKIIYIPTGSNYEDVLNILTNEKILKNPASFTKIAKLKKYSNKIKPGRYRILSGMCNNELVNMLRAGLQEPVTVTFHNVRAVEHIISRVCKKLEADSVELTAMLNNEQYVRDNLGLRTETVLTLFIPNTYEFNWNTSAKQFVERMQSEYKKFWNEDRKNKAKKLNLSQTHVSILASIVQAEQQAFPEERPLIAGLYLNRLRIGMALQSDPTLIYASGNFSINRVWNIDKEIDSPYNTYQHTGLPPGPINLPDISSLDAVLNPDINNYIYMCAKDDLSGKHNFTNSFDEHNRNAAKYRKALKKNNIFR